jgi:hypothetical protein
MAASCDVKINTINEFARLGAIDPNTMQIKSKVVFDTNNIYYSNKAKEKYNINTDELMFFERTNERDKRYNEPLPYYRIPDKELFYTAVPNEQFFQVLQRRFYEENDMDDLVEIEYKSIGSFLYKGSFPQFTREEITDNPEIIARNFDKEMKRVNEIFSSNKGFNMALSNTITKLGKDYPLVSKESRDYLREKYYMYVKNSYENQTSEGFNKFLIREVLLERKEQSKESKDLKSINTITGFPDIKLEC